MNSGGDPWSTTRGVFPFGHPRVIKPACGFPRLIAACHVLRRQASPRHSLIALCYLITNAVLNRIVRFDLLDYSMTFPQCIKLSKNEKCFSPKSVFRGECVQKMVGPGGLEPPTPRLSSACSNQLSYEPGWVIYENGFMIYETKPEASPPPELTS
jgi:hypothetical protein